jgi:hypothetical protein
MPEDSVDGLRVFGMYPDKAGGRHVASASDDIRL